MTLILLLALWLLAVALILAFITRYGHERGRS